MSQNESRHNVQVGKDHYDSLSYDDLPRFVSYFNQKDCVLAVLDNLKSGRVLEIGVGNGFLSDYLNKHGVSLTTFDYSDELNPDIVGDVINISDYVKEKYSIVCAFEILEHVEYKNQEKVLEQLESITTDYLLISLPQSRLYISLWLKTNILKPFSFFFNLPFPIKHKFDGQHYWELGKRGYSVGRYRTLLRKHFDVVKEYTDPLDFYHRFFVLKKK